MSDSPLLTAFDNDRRRYEELCLRLESLLGQLLRERRIAVHSVASRVKDRESFARKVARKGTAYRSIQDVTDLAGIRIISFFADQVDAIAQLISSEFVVDDRNSVDKRALLDPDRFGYLSLHYVVSLSHTRSALTEYQSLRELKAEIQIRSILQHTWAEIEHDLGYKAANELPQSVRRRFARLASLLELADSEFVGIRNDLDAYGQEVSAKIIAQPDTVELNKISLLEFIRSDAQVRDMDARIAAAFEHTIREDEESVANDVGKLEFFGIKTIADARALLSTHRAHILRLSAYWASTSADEPADVARSMPEGIALYYLCHVMAAATQDAERVKEYLEKFSIGNPDETSHQIAEDLVQFMKRSMTVV